MKLASYWHDTAPRFDGAVQAPPGGRADVVVVGGGFTGLSAALALAKKGAQVVLLEAERVGSAASGRNGGHVQQRLRPGLRRHVCAARHRTGEPAVPQLRRWRGHRRADRRRGGNRLRLPPRPASSSSRPSPRTTTSWRVRQELLAREVDPDTHMVSKAALSEELGSDAYYGGLVFGKSAGMHMGKFVQRAGERGRAQRRAHPREHALDRHCAAPQGATRWKRQAARAGTPGPACHRHIGGGPPRLVPAAHCSGRCLHHRHGAAAAGPARSDPAAAPDGDEHPQSRQLLPRHAGQPAALRWPRAIRRPRPGIGQEKRRDPAPRPGRHLSRISRTCASTIAGAAWST